MKTKMTATNNARKLRQLKYCLKVLRKSKLFLNESLVNKIKNKLKRLFYELSFFIQSPILKKGMLVGGLLLGSTLNNDCFSQNFQTDSILNLNSVSDNIISSKFIDMDNDGDLDLITAESEYDFSSAHFIDIVKYYKNNSIGNNFSFELQDTLQLTFDFTGDLEDHAYYYHYQTFDFKDIDNDGDFDFFILRGDFFYNYYFGNYYYTSLSYNLNIGTTEIPQFTQVELDIALPSISSISIGPDGPNDYSILDIDNDSDLDVIFQDNNNLVYFENIGTSNSYDFLTPQYNPFNLPLPDFTSRFKFIDIDNDDDFDLFLGGNDWIKVCQNNGSEFAPNFSSPQSPSLLYNLNIGTGNNNLGEFIDFDHDGDIDFLNQKGTDFMFYENIGSSIPNFNSPIENPFNLSTNQIFNDYFQVGDLEGDGDYDFFLKDLSDFTYNVYIDTTFILDLDNDGASSIVDCNDNNANIYPGATEIPDNGIDEDCDGYDLSLTDSDNDGYNQNLDCDDNNASIWYLTILYIDEDGDNYGVDLQNVCRGSSIPLGFAPSGSDCDDTDESIYFLQNLHPDNDGDFYGVSTIISVCRGITVPIGYSDSYNTSDCDDNNALIWDLDQLYVDADGDTKGAGVAVAVCRGNTIPSGYDNENVDCDDNDATVYPGAEEICDQKDNDCDTQIDENLVAIAYYTDTDGDNFGSELETEFCSNPGVGFSTNNTDCDDANPNINPTATEIPDNGIDEDCDGLDLLSSLSENLNNTFKLYPNPGKDKIVLELNSITSNYRIKILNSIGSIVYELNELHNIKTEINTKQLESGMYYFEVSNENGKSILKWIKN